MTAALDDKRRRRDDVLIELYDRAESGQGTLEFVEESEIAKTLGLEESEVDTISRYLVDQGYATFPVMGNVISITASGTNRAEQIIDEREREAVAIAGLILTHLEVEQLEAAIGPLRAALDSGDVPLQGDDLAEFDADVQTIQDQIRSPRPKREIVRAALRSIGDFLARPDLATGIFASGITTAIFEVAKLIH
ncbi:MAG: hypothetical protein ACLPVY_05240 [Acidimicrobiia bacterium]